MRGQQPCNQRLMSIAFRNKLKMKFNGSERRLRFSANRKRARFCALSALYSALRAALGAALGAAHLTCVDIGLLGTSARLFTSHAAIRTSHNDINNRLGEWIRDGRTPRMSLNKLRTSEPTSVWRPKQLYHKGALISPHILLKTSKLYKIRGNTPCDLYFRTIYS